MAWRGEAGELVLVVSDGMGGHAAGREASRAVVSTCLATIRQRGAEAWPEILLSALDAAHAAVLEAARVSPERASMGATAVLAVVEPGDSALRLHVAHVGDSRVYLFRGKSLYRLTADHSLVSQMVRDGLLTEEDAIDHPDSNVIQRAMGQASTLVPEVQDPMSLEPGDMVLVSSDGLHGTVRDEVIAGILATADGMEATCQNLLAAALDQGSEDDITIGCARVAASARRRRPTRV